MEIIASIILIIVIIGWPKLQNSRVCNYCNSHEVDWGKVNNDRIMNNLSNSQVNKNILSGKYGSGRIKTQAEIKAEQEAIWEDFKRRHPHGKWN